MTDTPTKAAMMSDARIKDLRQEAIARPWAWYGVGTIELLIARLDHEIADRKDFTDMLSRFTNNYFDHGKEYAADQLANSLLQRGKALAAKEPTDAH